MLAPPNDFGYSPATHHHTMGGYEQQHHHAHSGERPKLFMESHSGAPQHAMHGGMHHPGMGDFQHMVGHNGHAAMTPQHHHQGGGDFDHEPLMMNMHNPQSHFYPPLGQQMLHVSSDYASSMDGTTPSGRSANSKRSREDLNLKEKKRMFKLNDRITQLKQLLDEAGVQSKKNKQSILDNTYHYVGMLRSNLLIAKQKAERAEKQAELFRNQKGGSSSEADAMYKRCFMQSSTARVLVGTDMMPISYNQAFLEYTGLSEESMKGNAPSLRPSLCLDMGKLDTILKIVKEGKPMGTVVQARSVSGVSPITLMASPMMDESGNVSSIEFSLIPLETSQTPTYHGKSDGKETSPSGVELEL